MSATNRIASQALTTGQFRTSPAAFDTSGQNTLTIQLIVTQIGTVLSTVRCCILDHATGHKLGTIVVEGSDTKVLEIQPVPLSADIELECLAGSAQASVNQLVGGDQEAFPAGSFDLAFCTSVFPAGAIPGAALASGPFSLDSLIADPGNGANIVVTTSGHVHLNIAGGGHNRGLPDPVVAGQVILITHTAGANAGTVTAASGIDPAGNTVLNFVATLGQSILLYGVDVGGGSLEWRVAWMNDIGLVPPYVPVVADPGNGAGIAVTQSGVVSLNILAGGHNRSLAAPTYEGQKLTIKHTAGNFAGTVTVTNGFCAGGATVLNFVSAATEQQSITLIGTATAAGLRWRVSEDANRIPVSRTIADPGAAGAIPVTYDNGIVDLTIAAPADDRTLADPTFSGQTLIIRHTAGANAGTVSAASDVTATGGQNVINFTAALTEYVELAAVGGKWRIVSNPDALTIN